MKVKFGKDIMGLLPLLVPKESLPIVSILKRTGDHSVGVHKICTLETTSYISYLKTVGMTEVF